MSAARLMLLFVVVGLALGAASGRRTFDRLRDPRPMCGTCHHTLTRLEDEPLGEPPHRTELGVECHRCHVVPVKEYLVAVSSVFGVEPPALVDRITDPTVGDQTCLGCHVGRGRGALDCDRCHLDGQATPDLSGGCTACHAERPTHPHDDQACRSCHVESTLGHRARTQALMRDKLYPEHR
ncbi:MAG: hypothetical protein ABMA64_40250 [Myxococcota bacterium]